MSNGSGEGDDAVLTDFLEAYCADRERGVVRTLDDYLLQFPGHVEAIAKEFLSLKEGDAIAREHGNANRGMSAPAGTASGGAAGDRIGHYRVLDEIGRGGQGIVYLAEDTRLHRKVALKVLKGMGILSEDSLARFRREAEAASRLDHPGICAVYEAAALDGKIPYIAMRLVEGESLAATIASARSQGEPSADTSFVHLADVEAPLSPSIPGTDPSPTPSGPTTRAEIMRVVQLIEKAARALHVAHEAGVVHRDIKPGNVMVTPGGDAVIMDFGLASLEDDQLPTLTRTGEFFGTPAYMSPEQLLAQRIRLDRRTDVYSLGITLYECLTLRRPFEAPTREGLYKQILTKDPPDLRSANRSISSDLRVVVETALEKDRDRRYQTALAFAEDLRRLRQFEPIVARPAGPILRLRRWAQRNPAIAVSSALVFLLLAGGLVVTTSLLGVYWAERKAKTEALEEQTKIAAHLKTERDAKEAALRSSESLRLAQESHAVREHNPTLALLLGLEAAKQAPGPKPNGALLAALADYRERATFIETGGLLGAWFLGDDETIVTVAKKGTISVWGDDRGQPLRSFGSGERLLCAAADPRGGLVAVVSEAGSISIWDARSGKIRTVVGEGPTAPWGVTFSPDGRILAAAHPGGVIRVWDASNGASVCKYRVADAYLWALRFSPDGSSILSWYDTGGARGFPQAHVWGARSGAKHAVFSKHAESIIFGEFLPGGDEVVTVATDDVFHVWNARTGTSRLRKALGTHWPVAMLEDRLAFFSPGDGGGVFSLRTGERVGEFGKVSDGFLHETMGPPDEDNYAIGPESLVSRSVTTHPKSLVSRSVTTHPGSGLMATAARGGVIIVWRMATLEVVATIRGNAGYDFREVSFSPQGGRLLALARNGVAHVFELRSWGDGASYLDGTVLGYWESAPGGMSFPRLSFLVSDDRLPIAMTVGADGWVAATRFPSGRSVRLEPVMKARASIPVGQKFVLYTRGEAGATVWSANVPSRLLGRVGDPQVPIEEVHGSASGEFVVINSKVGARVWRLPTFEPVSTAVVNEFIDDVDPSVTRLLTYVYDEEKYETTFRIRDAASGAESCRVTLRDARFVAVTLRSGKARFVADGARFVTSGSRIDDAADSLSVRDSKSGAVLLSLSRKPASYWALGGNRDLLAFMLKDANAVSVVDCVRLEEVCRIPVKAKVEHLGFDHAGRRLLISTADGHATVYESVSGSRLLSVRVNASKLAEGGPGSTSFSPGGGFIVSGNRLWRSDSGAEWLALPSSFPKLIDDEWTVLDTGTGRSRLVPLYPAQEALRLKTRPFTFDEVDLHSIGDASDRARVRDLLAEPIPNEDLLRRLSSERLHDEVLAAALCSAQVRPTRALAARLNNEAWEVVMRSGAGEAAYGEALRRAECAHACEPNDDAITKTLGVAQLRIGRYREALQTLEAAAAGNRRRGEKAEGWYLVPIAMARFHLGDRAAAIEILEPIRPFPAQRTNSIDDVLDEARTLVGLGAFSWPTSRRTSRPTSRPVSRPDSR